MKFPFDFFKVGAFTTHTKALAGTLTLPHTGDGTYRFSGMSELPSRLPSAPQQSALLTCKDLLQP